MKLWVECRFAPYAASHRDVARLANRTVFRGRPTYEAFGEQAFDVQAAVFNLSHGAAAVGHVRTIVPDGQGWWIADALVDVPDDHPCIDEIRRRVVPGARISPAFSIVDEDCENLNGTYVSFVRACDLLEISLLERGDIAGYTDARILSAREPRVR